MEANNMATPIGDLMHPMTDGTEVPVLPLSQSETEIPERRIKGAEIILSRVGFIRGIAGDKDYFAAAKAWATSATLRKGLFVWGSFGCGKTHLINCIKQFMPGIVTIYLGDPNGANLIDVESSTEICRDLADRSVYLDDVGSEATLHDYGSVRERVGEFITYYHLHGKGMLYVTTNLNSEELESRYSMRVLSRLKDLTVPLHMKGGDKRKFFAERMKGE